MGRRILHGVSSMSLQYDGPESTASLIRNPDGTLQYFVAGVVDITGRKDAETAAASLSGRLIEAQEDERRHFAREIHDDLGQRVAVLSVGLQQLRKSFDSEDPRQASIQELIRSIEFLSEGFHNLSHRLHSSKLEYVGLVPAINTIRPEYEKQGFELNFTHQDVPGNLPWKVAISVFRIIQEAVSNPSKYSGVRKVDLQLNGFPGEISLSLHDSGVGFDCRKGKVEGRSRASRHGGTCQAPWRHNIDRVGTEIRYLDLGSNPHA